MLPLLERDKNQLRFVRQLDPVALMSRILALPAPARAPFVVVVPLPSSRMKGALTEHVIELPDFLNVMRIVLPPTWSVLRAMSVSPCSSQS
jgi:hypothetical protein